MESLLPDSTEHSMKKPPMRRLTLAKQPQARPPGIHRRVVIARDLAPIPPSRLDPLRLSQQPQSPPPPRHPIPLAEQPRHRQQPQRTDASTILPDCGIISQAALNRGRSNDRLSDPPGPLRPMILNDIEPIHRLIPQPHPQPLNEVRRLRGRTAPMLSGPPQPSRSKHPRNQRPRPQLTSPHRLRQHQRTQLLPQQRPHLPRISQRRRQPQHTARSAARADAAAGIRAATPRTAAPAETPRAPPAAARAPARSAAWLSNS